MNLEIKRITALVLAGLLLLMLPGCNSQQSDIPLQSPAIISSETQITSTHPSPDLAGTPGSVLETPELERIPTENTQSPETMGENGIPVSEKNDGLIRLGMSRAEAESIMQQRGLQIKEPNYYGITPPEPCITYIGYDESDKLITLSSTFPTSMGLEVGDSVVDMIRLHGTSFIDIGSGMGEDSFLYGYGDYSLIIQFYNHDEYTVTGWMITSLEDFSWDTVRAVYESYQSSNGDSINNKDRIVVIADAEFVLGQGKQSVLHEAEGKGLRYKILEDGSLRLEEGLTVYFDREDIVNHMKLWGPTAKSYRGLSSSNGIIDMVALHGLNFEAKESEGRYPTTVYHMGNDEVSIDICYLKSNPYTTATFDIYLSSLYPIYE